MEEATWNLLDKGEKIAKEARALKEELTAALQEVRRESEYPEGRQEQPASPQGAIACSGFVGVLFCRLEFISLAHSCEEGAVGGRVAH